MIFEVVRTSSDGTYNEWLKKPCDEAELTEFIEKDFLTSFELERWSHYDIARWMEEGMNHQALPDGSYVKEVKRQRWVVKINTIDELEKFVKKYGHVIVGRPWGGSEMPTLEIYDDYHE